MSTMKLEREWEIFHSSLLICRGEGTAEKRDWLGKIAYDSIEEFPMAPSVSPRKGNKMSKRHKCTAIEISLCVEDNIDVE